MSSGLCSATRLPGAASLGGLVSESWPPRGSAARFSGGGAPRGERSLVREALDLLCRERKVRDELAAAFDLQRPSFLVDRVAPVVLLYHSPQRVSVPAQVHLPHLCEAAGTWQGAPTTLFLTLRMALTIRV